MRALPGLAVLALVVLAGVAAAPAGAGGQAAPCVGTLTSPANGTTVISVQGARYGGEFGKTQPRLVAVGPRGRVKWTYNHTDGVVWSYDVDPMANGNLFVTATRPGETLLFEFDPETRERVWTEVTPFTDTHDADLLNRTHVAVANMRNYDGGENADRLLVYDRTTDRVTWEWRFADHYPRRVGGDYTDDWTHVNDIDPVGEDRFLASPRNFDQVILVNRTTGEVELSLGADGAFDVLRKQHNPQYLESEDGRPTFLVADSENHRVVEYERRDGGWVRTWSVGSSASLTWPRDADRLPNGNTLVVDSRGNRVVEVTPDGTVVWEVYAPWLVYDAERVRHGDEAGGPTMADLGATGHHDLTGDRRFPGSRVEACDAAIDTFVQGSWTPPTATPSAAPGGTSVVSTTTFRLGALATIVALVVVTVLSRDR